MNNITEGENFVADQWYPAPLFPGLTLDIAHVWKFTLNPEAELLGRLGLLLSEDEIQRAERFHFSVHRDRFIAAHGYLRDILARYVKIPPQALKFEISEFGKPALIAEQGGLELAFNLSHSHELGLVAVSRRPAVGVDIEYIQPDLAEEQVARRYFSETEIALFLDLPLTLRTQAFFLCWTRKEAYIKAIGEGLSMPLDRFDVTLTPGERAQLLATRPDPAQALQWKLYSFCPARNYAAAMVIAGRDVDIKLWEWRNMIVR